MAEIIDDFFKRYIAKKWQPLKLEVEDRQDVKNALLDIGTRLVGPGFVLDENALPVYMKTALYLLGHGEGLDVAKGLYIWGRVGCGKTTVMKVCGVFAQIYCKGNGHRMLHCHDAAHNYQAKGSVVFEEEAIGTLCFDELGSEPPVTGYYGTPLAVMAMHIEKRYRVWVNQGRWTHFTSNFNLKWCGEHYGVREADRLKEMCNVIEMPGGTRRKT